MDHQKHFKSFGLDQETFATAVELVLGIEKFISLFLVLVDFVFVSNFEIRVKDSEHQTHEQEEPQHHINQKEKAVGSKSHVSGQHNVREIGSGEADQHAPERIF